MLQGCCTVNHPLAETKQGVRAIEPIMPLVSLGVGAGRGQGYPNSAMIMLSRAIGRGSRYKSLLLICLCGVVLVLTVRIALLECYKRVARVSQGY
jgi:hypothetical protein